MSLDYRHAVYAGSFDPVTFGHTAIIKRAMRVFDRVTVAIGLNPNKKTLFDLELRKQMIRDAIGNAKHVEIEPFEGLLIDFMRKHGAGVIVRGLRLLTDFEYEMQLGLANRDMEPDVETIFLLTESVHVYISSSLVKEIAQNGGDVSRYVHASVEAELRRRFPRAP